MRKSRAVPLTLLAIASLATTTACDDGPTETRNCVDSQKHIVSDKQCAQPTAYGGGGGGYHFIYGGASGGRVGDTVVGGSDTAEAGARVVSAETGGVVRGGFGGEGEGGHGGGE
jgi:hypothetical protein